MQEHWELTSDAKEQTARSERLGVERIEMAPVAMRSDDGDGMTTSLLEPMRLDDEDDH